MDGIVVCLHTLLSIHAPDGIKEFEVYDIPGTVSELADKLGITPGEIGVVLINKKLSKLEDSLAPRDRVDLYPVFAGG